jgi:hypothetical protein
MQQQQQQQVPGVAQGRGAYPGNMPALSPLQMQLLPGTPPNQLPSPNQAALPALSPGGYTSGPQVGAVAGRAQPSLHSMSVSVGCKE